MSSWRAGGGAEVVYDERGVPRVAIWKVRIGEGACIFYQTGLRRIFKAPRVRVQHWVSCSSCFRGLTRRLLFLQIDELTALHA